MDAPGVIEVVSLAIRTYLSENGYMVYLGTNNNHNIDFSYTNHESRLKVKTLEYHIHFMDDRATLLLWDVAAWEFPYADPGFPDTLYAKLPRVGVKS